MRRLVLRLYVAGDGPNSVAARANLRRILAPYDASTLSVEIVDCLQEPMRALREGVLVTPTLLRLEPTPMQTLIGSLSDTRRVIETLGLEAPDAPVADTAAALAHGSSSGGQS